MMHGRGESDSAIVAAKPTNKAERSAAEPVEPRAGTKGNASQQSTGRTQRRKTVSQALERIRQAARQRKKERFTALLHHVNVDLLRQAFFEIKKDAAPGSVPGAPVTAGLQPKAGRSAASTCGRRPGGQDRPTADGGGAKRDLRG